MTNINLHILLQHDVRKLVFEDSLNFIQKHNEEEARGLHTYKVGVNKFADLTNKEFNAMYSGNLAFDDSVPRTKVMPKADLPKTKDWRAEVRIDILHIKIILIILK